MVVEELIPEIGLYGGGIFSAGEKRGILNAMNRNGSKKDEDCEMNIKERAASLKRDIPAVFLALKARETPLLTKILAFLTVAYALSPIDLIPDFVPVLGYLDDLIILPALVFLTCKLIPREIFAAYQKQAEGMWQNGKPKKWYYAVPIVLVWALILYWIITKLV